MQSDDQKMTGETPEVCPNKRKPREDREKREETEETKETEESIYQINWIYFKDK